MAPRSRPHLLGIDDGPFEKGQDHAVPIVAVMMEGSDLVESVAINQFAVDGDDATGFLASWLDSLKVRPSLQGVVLGGVTIAGLGVVDIRQLAGALTLPVLVVTRKDTANHRVHEALETAGLLQRLEILERTPPAAEVFPGLFLACAGVEPGDGERLIRSSLGKAKLPEPLRVAHLIAAAISRGASRGRV